MESWDDMHKCRLASTKENLRFQHDYCCNEAAIAKIIKNFKVEVEAYEELPPWHCVYNADGSDVLLKDTVIMLKVSDLGNRVVYYPVFPESVGKKMLANWHIALPPKITVFADIRVETGADVAVHVDNQSLRRLIAFSRLFTMVPNRSHAPMPYGFNNLYAQLYQVPEMGVAPETVRMINEILGDFINASGRERYIYCDNLQDFIDYLKSRYKLLVFQNSDFTNLREMMRYHYPDEKIYF